MKTLIVEKNKIRNNLDAIKAAAGKAEIIAVLKINAYGLGLQQMAELCREAGIRRFFADNRKTCHALLRILCAVEGCRGLTRLATRTDLPDWRLCMEMQNGPFRTAKWAVLGGEMGRFGR